MSEKKDPKDTCVLVTGGAGFIGSHTVVELLQGGYQVVIVDDLSNASEKVIGRIGTIVGDEAAKNLTFHRADVNDRAALERIFTENQIDRVIHFAGFKAVGESVSKPIEYYSNNIGNTLTLGKGTSVLEIITAFGRACGKDVPYVIDPRRPGDVTANYADCSKAKELMGWEAKFDIDDMCRDSWNWQSHNPNGFEDAE